VDRAGDVMADDTYQRLQALIAIMSPAQLDLLEQAIKVRRGRSPAVDQADSVAAPGKTTPADAAGLIQTSPIQTSPIQTIEASFQADPACPHCQSKKLQKWGSAHGLQRYRCKVCKKTFNALTGTPLAQLHKRELWQQHSQALIDGLSLRKVGVRIGVSLPTAFRWRHRFLKAPKALKAKKLQGIVEADETFFLYSEKGKRNLTRKPRKRGGKAAKCGLSAEQVPVLIARDRTKATTDQILPDRSEKSVAAVLKPVVAKDAVLVTDGDKAFGAFADNARILHIGLVASKGEHSYEEFHFQNVNAYTSGLKCWMIRFKGVATKYLDTYLGWNRLNDRDGSTLTANSLLTTAIG
jgi:transposase-like protein